MKASVFSVVSLLLLAGPAGCDAVRVDRGDGEGSAARRGGQGVVVVLGPAGMPADLLATTLETQRDQLAIGDAIDVATQTAASVERVACQRLNPDVTSCAQLDVEADAAVMDDGGRFGGIAVVHGAASPVMLARLVAETPYLMIAGDGAMALAGMGSAPAAAPLGPPAPLAAAAISPSQLGALHGVAVVVRIGDDRFAAALSTAGTLRMPRGRMTAAAVEGASVFAGPEGAVVVSGDPGHLVRNQLARSAYERLAGGEKPNEVVAWLLADLPESRGLAAAVIGRNSSHVGSNRQVPTTEVRLELPEQRATTRALR